MSKACNQTSPHRVVHICHDNRHGRIEALRRTDAGGSVRYDYSRIFLSQLARKLWKTLIVATCEARLFEDIVTAFD